MLEKTVLTFDEIPIQLYANLENRDAGLWIRDIPKDFSEKEKLQSLYQLPWKLIISEASPRWLIENLEDPSNAADSLVRKRGFIQVIATDPSHCQLPPRSLPIYLFNGRLGETKTNFLDNQLRQLNMVEALRRSQIKDLLVISFEESPIPMSIGQLWDSGYRTNLFFVTDWPQAQDELKIWIDKKGGLVSLFNHSSTEFLNKFVFSYLTNFPDERVVVRVRDQKGGLHKIDFSEIDDPENPILDKYSLILEKHLSPVTPEELSETEFVDFFQNPEKSWRPFAVGLPWVRETIWLNIIEERLKRLDSEGPEANCVGFFSVEPGAGGTTMLREVGWRLAQKGYPSLIANFVPFQPDCLAISNFLLRAYRHLLSKEAKIIEKESGKREGIEGGGEAKQYETPWILMFDRMHWDYRESELRRFCLELQKHGRPCLILVVTDSTLDRIFSEDKKVFEHVGTLNHLLGSEEALRLGEHLNTFLRNYGKAKKAWEWEKFFGEHVVQLNQGFSSFWITLSFWIQGQYNLTESIQEWMFKAVKEKIKDTFDLEVIFQIAAMSSERLPFPNSLLPLSNGEYPLSHLLEEYRTKVPALGLMPLREGDSKYWGLAHDLLGRFLINALFFDRMLREALGYIDAKDSEHLRFLILQKVAKKPELGETGLRKVGEDFATAVFKIDQERGRAGFANYWRNVLETLDSMAPSLRRNSRVFLHHTAISRRRVAILDEAVYEVTDKDREVILNQAIEDINFALSSIPYTPGSESNLNLYNSLARAYFDLAQVVGKNPERTELAQKLRKLGNEATHRAFEENPTNSYVLETYVKNLLINAQSFPERAVELCVKALGTVFTAISSSEDRYRFPALAGLANEALKMLFEQVGGKSTGKEPTTAVEILVETWIALTQNVEGAARTDLCAIPMENRTKALEILGRPAGRGNIEVLRLSYQIVCVTFPSDFIKQLQLLEELEKSEIKLSPQLKLEYALLLYQNKRAVEGEKVFAFLRNLWRENDYFVHIPVQLRWLWEENGETPKKVSVIMYQDSSYRAFAKVPEFGNRAIPFRPEEFGLRNAKPGARFTCHVSFGHNGPFLRPTTSGPR